MLEHPTWGFVSNHELLNGEKDCAMLNTWTGYDQLMTGIVSLIVGSFDVKPGVTLSP